MRIQPGLILGSAAIVLFSAAGCSGSVSSESSSAPAAAAAGAATSDYCEMFTTDQTGAALGKPVKAGHTDPASAIEGCQWDATDGRGTVLIQVLAAGLWNDLRGGTGLRSVDGIGEKAYIGPSPLGGVQAGAIAGDALFFVRVDPPRTDDIVTGLLRTFVNRTHPRG